ncbi:ABC transporter substrate-binding protein [Streptomyces sp. NPDC048436]|uniref:peptide ABC transporter substrate-binding protein n=1 Tax=Streptomyces sp. NPDC048436 TaxID=3365550 RepID=UPI00371A61A4
MSAPVPRRMIRVNGAEPQNPLIPSDTVEGIGGRIIDQLFTGLFHYDADGRVLPAVLDQLETADHQHFRITLRSDWTFTDGTRVTAHSFVDAWNWAANSTNRQQQQAFFAPIAGYEDVAAHPPTALRMSGLHVIDDHTFTVSLRRPDRDFPATLGNLAAKPLPSAFFTMGPAAFGEQPIGNGPYRLAGPAGWKHHDSISLLPNPDYPGPGPVRNDGIRVVFYDDLADAYADLTAGDLDVLDSIPDSLLARFHTDMGHQAAKRRIALNSHLAIPADLAHFTGQEGRLRRRALSQAIDRDQLINRLLGGTRIAATDFTTGVLREDDAPFAAGDVLLHNPHGARTAWAQADDIRPFTGSLDIAYHASGGYDRWVIALAEQISTVLGIACRPIVYPTFKSIRDHIKNGTLDAAFRTGWRGDYPSQVNFLEPLFVTGAPCNETGYSSEAFDTALHEAKTAPTERAAAAHLRSAQDVLFADLPVIPLWDHQLVAGVSASVHAPFKWNGMADYPAIEPKDAPQP